jgi:hypothetical protein
MAITFQLVESTPYRLRYLATTSATGPDGGIIPNNGGASPDLQTDLANDPSGPLRACVNARRNGFGFVPAGTPLTQAQARAVLNTDNLKQVTIGNSPVTAITTRQIVAPTTAQWAVDIGVDGEGDPVVQVATVAGPGTCYIDIHCRHSIDL